MKTFYTLLLLLFANCLVGQNISNKVDVSIWTGTITPLGNKIESLGDAKFLNHFSNSTGEFSFQSRVMYHTSLFAYGLNIEYDKLKTKSLDGLDLIGISPVFSIEKQILFNPLKFNLNIMPTLYHYKSILNVGEVVSNNIGNTNLQTIDQMIPGLKMSIGIKLKIIRSVSIGAEFGGSVMKDNSVVTAEKVCYYQYMQLGLIMKFLFNKRYYLQNE